ncbi:MAG: asparagine synthase (glutamine-hydrolyzing) [Candidatus Omnitrophica bacterium]|nr:asparagine synthase (glutamine-hydrolyzing) [Candidatus Omnitrophota bacterium]
MCGFAGYIDFERSPATTFQVREMSQAIAHRGTDEIGIFSTNSFAAVHSRLVTIGSSGGQQPMCDRAEKTILVYNGELYNYREIREILQRKGYAFESDSDTEVILNSYKEWGEGCVGRFNGIFSFCLFDKFKNVLYMARDHLGVKPLYYYRRHQSLFFASEISALLCNQQIPRELDYTAFAQYLSLNYVPGPLTLFKGIHQLEPGTYVSFSPEEMRKVQYWDILENEKKEYTQKKQYEERFECLLEDAVHKRTIGVPQQGVLLSGGIDSSAISYFLDQDSRPLSTFSLGFREKKFDDNRRYAQWFSRQLKTDHHEIVISSADVDIHTLQTLMKHNSDLIADPSIIPTYFISQFASQSVKILFVGTGADEILAGYDTYVADKLLCMLSRFLSPAGLQYVHKILDIRCLLGDNPWGMRFKLKRFLQGTQYPLGRAHFFWREVFSGFEREQLCCPAITERMGNYDPFSLYDFYYRKREDASILEKVLYADQKILLLSMLKRLDSMTSAFSLMSRVPFLDHRLVAFCAHLPLEMKLHRFTTKYIFKRIMAGKIPHKIIHRPKRGFTTPLSLWIRNDWGKTAEEVFFSSKLTGQVFQRKYIEILLRQHRLRQEDHSWKIFGLLCFYLWAERYNIKI